MKKYLCAGLVAAALLSACSQSGNGNVVEITVENNKVTVSGDSPILSKLERGEVKLSPFSTEIRTVGSVQAEPDCYAEVGVPFDGRISRSLVKLGSKVRAGQPLFEMMSPEFISAGKDYFQSRQNFEKASLEYERRKTLHEHGISSQKELDEAYAEAENCRREMESASGMISVFGIDPSSLKMGQPMSIVAPIGGEVVACRLTGGLYTKSDSEALVTIADLSKVWVTALVKERFIGNVSAGQKVEVFVESAPDTPIYGDIIHVGKIVDPETRSIQVVVSCDNHRELLKHGMYVSVHFMSEQQNAVVLPSSAVFQGEERCYVYVCTPENNVFERRQVEIGSSNDDNSSISIRSGLHEGETVLMSGGMYLNS